MVKIKIQAYSRYKKLNKHLMIDIDLIKKLKVIEVTPSYFNHIEKLEGKREGD